MVERVERELTLLVRRAQRVHLRTEGIKEPLERSAYSILGRLHDQGPLRPGTLAALFHLDASTVSRQVAALEHAGLIARKADPQDGRAYRLELTDLGTRALSETREARRDLMRDLLASWPQADQAALAHLLEQLNRGLDDLLAIEDRPTGRAGRGVPVSAVCAVARDERAAQ